MALERFYLDVLGLTLETRQGKLAQLRAGSGLIDIVPADEPGPARGTSSTGGANLDHLCLRVEPFDAAAIANHLTQRGITCGSPSSGSTRLKQTRATKVPSWCAQQSSSRWRGSIPNVTSSRIWRHNTTWKYSAGALCRQPAASTIPGVNSYAEWDSGCYKRRNSSRFPQDRSPPISIEMFHRPSDVHLPKSFRVRISDFLIPGSSAVIHRRSLRRTAKDLALDSSRQKLKIATRPRATAEQTVARSLGDMGRYPPDPPANGPLVPYFKINVARRRRSELVALM